MRTTERVDVARLSPDHQMQNPLRSVSSSLQVSPPPFLRLERILSPNSASERSSISSQDLQNFEITLSRCNAFRRYNPMVQQKDVLYLLSLLHDFPDHSWVESMRHCKSCAQSSAISNDLGLTEEQFQPPKSHQIVDSLPHEIKSSLFSSLFRTCES